MGCDVIASDSMASTWMGDPMLRCLVRQLGVIRFTTVVVVYLTSLQETTHPAFESLRSSETQGVLGGRSSCQEKGGSSVVEVH